MGCPEVWDHSLGIVLLLFLIKNIHMNNKINNQALNNVTKKRTFLLVSYALHSIQSHAYMNFFMPIIMG